MVSLVTYYHVLATKDLLAAVTHRTAMRPWNTLLGADSPAATPGASKYVCTSAAAAPKPTSMLVSDVFWMYHPLRVPDATSVQVFGVPLVLALAFVGLL